MREVWIALILLAPMLPAAAGQSGAEPLLTDPAGDAEWTPVAAGQRLPGAPATGADAVRGNDLRALHVVETEDALAFVVTVDSMQGEPQGTAAQVELAFGDRDYRLWMSWFSGSASTSQGGAYSWLQRREGSSWSYVAQLDPPAVDRSAATIAATLPKVYLMDAQHRVPGRGDAVEIVRVATDANFIGLGLVSARVSDEMAAGAAVTMALGDFSTGDLLLTAHDRVRVSNGGATTFVFQARMKNGGDAPHEMRLAVEDLPAGWQARVQPTVVLPPGEERTVAVLVSVPFAHEHGGYSSFNLTAASARDAATAGRIRLGVLHTPIPQPAGHHSELYLHANNNYGGPLGPPFEATLPSSWGWMNTVADHSEDYEFVTANVQNGALVWWIPLNPRLLVGLDFDLDGIATLDGAFLGGAGEAEVTSELYYWRDTAGGGESVMLAEARPTTVTLGDSEQPFSLALTPLPESDYIPYAPDTYLTLRIGMTANVAQALASSSLRPKLMVEPFKLKLPLHEYHDRLSGDAEAASSIAIVAKGPVEKLGHGGATLAYTFEVSGTPGETVVIDLAGNDARIARAVPSGAVKLGDTPLEVVVGVNVPTESKPGEEFEVLLFVHERDDPTKMAIARTKTRVAATGEAAAGDERAVLAEAEARHKNTPVPALLGALALAGVALARRRATS